MEEESITDDNNFTADTFSHASSATRENSIAIFTSDNLDKSDKIVDSVDNLTINGTKYYESNTANASDAQGNLTSNPKTVTYTSNGIFEQKLLSYWIISVLHPPMNPRNVAIKFMTQTLLTPATKYITV